jgi:hypothetical protein
VYPEKWVHNSKAPAETVNGRQECIRRRYLSGESSDKIAHYIGKIQAIREEQVKRLARGENVECVAMSERDFQTVTRAYAEKDLLPFGKAWASMMKYFEQLPAPEIKKAGRQTVKVAAKARRWGGLVILLRDHRSTIGLVSFAKSFVFVK